MRISLSGLGWVDKGPIGNRLRWSYPLQPVQDNTFLCLPKSMIIERAIIPRRELEEAHGRATLPFPIDWWDTLAEKVTVKKGEVVFTYPLKEPVQAVSFEWIGMHAHILFRDSQTDETVAIRHVHEQTMVYVEGYSINTIIVISPGGTIAHLRALRMYNDFDFKFSPLAEIAVSDSYTSNLNVVGKRYGDLLTMSQSQWDDLKEVVEEARLAKPYKEGEPTALDQLELILGTRWEYAVLGGFGYFDGPFEHDCNLDKQLDTCITEPDMNSLYVYRVYPEENPEWKSNMIICRPEPVPSLNAPSIPNYKDAKVRMVNPGNLDGNFLDSGRVTPLSPLPSKHPYRVNLTLESMVEDPLALGIEYEEIVSSSPMIGSPEEHRQFIHRSGEDNGTPKQDWVARSFEVAFPDVTLQVRGRTIDGWDRVSDFSAWNEPTPLRLIHEPLAPPLLSASFQAGQVRLVRKQGQNSEPDWTPDSLVAQFKGQIEVYHQVGSPLISKVSVGKPDVYQDGNRKATVSGVDPKDFIGGTLQAGWFSETIIDADDQHIYWRYVDTTGQGGTIFEAGEGKLVQSDKHPSLWTKVAEFPIEDLPQELVFGDPLPQREETIVESYMLRVSYWNRLGPPGEMVRAIRQPHISIPIPPSITVELAGLDFYKRALLKVSFNQEMNGGSYTLWWADGIVAPEDMPVQGSMGCYPNQILQEGRYFYEVLELPIQQSLERTITVGVQSTSIGGGLGAITTTIFKIPPVA